MSKPSSTTVADHITDESKTLLFFSSNNNNTNTNMNGNTNPISQLKFNASKLNQQLLLSIIPNTSTTDSTTLSSKSSLLPFELMKMISQFEQYCDELITIQSNVKEQQSEIKQYQQQLQIKEQQFELKQKQQQFEFEQQKHNFQLQSRQQQQRQQQQNEEFYNIDEFVSLPLSTLSSSPSSSSSSQPPTTTMSTTNTALIELPLQHEQQQQHEQEQQQEQPHQSITTSLTTSKVQDETNTITPIISNELLQHVIQDYQSMKYLVEQSTTTQQLFQQHYAILNEKMKDVDGIKQFQSKVNKIDEIESQLMNLTSTFQQSFQDQSKQFDQRLILFEQTHQQQLTAKMIENQRKQVPLVLTQNRDLMKDVDLCQFIIFQIENCPDIQSSCVGWDYYHTIYDAFYNNLIPDAHPTKLQPLEETIKASKLYISSKSVLNGEWIQIQGDGAVIDIKTTKIFDFIKPGDNIYPIKDYQCKECEFDHDDDDDTTTNRFLIKFKWE